MSRIEALQPFPRCRRWSPRPELPIVVNIDTVHKQKVNMGSNSQLTCILLAHLLLSKAQGHKALDFFLMGLATRRRRRSSSQSCSCWRSTRGRRSLDRRSRLSRHRDFLGSNTFVSSFVVLMNPHSTSSLRVQVETELLEHHQHHADAARSWKDRWRTDTNA